MPKYRAAFTFEAENDAEALKVYEEVGHSFIGNSLELERRLWRQKYDVLNDDYKGKVR